MKKPRVAPWAFVSWWLRRTDVHRRPVGYEPTELLLLHSAKLGITDAPIVLCRGGKVSVRKVNARFAPKNSHKKTYPLDVVKSRDFPEKTAERTFLDPNCIANLIRQHDFFSLQGRRALPLLLSLDLIDDRVIHSCEATVDRHEAISDADSMSVAKVMPALLAIVDDEEVGRKHGFDHVAQAPATMSHERWNDRAIDQIALVAKGVLGDTVLARLSPRDMPFHVSAPFFCRFLFVV